MGEGRSVSRKYFDFYLDESPAGSIICGSGVEKGMRMGHAKSSKGCSVFSRWNAAAVVVMLAVGAAGGCTSKTSRMWAQNSPVITAEPQEMAVQLGAKRD